MLITLSRERNTFCIESCTSDAPQPGVKCKYFDLVSLEHTEITNQWERTL